MPIRPFSGNTFVAFIDISGFKLMMNNNEIALQALTQFYQAGYDALDENGSVQGFFVSDCGILFSDHHDSTIQMHELLLAIKHINRRMLAHDIMLTTSICYGHFSYTSKLEFQGIDKNPIYGDAYLNAYLDNANGKPKIEPGQCRILLQGMEEDQITQLMNNQFLQRRGHSHLYYYWNLNNTRHVQAFESRYKDSYNRKFLGMIEALKYNY